jgi:hypothetical protein
MPPRQPKILRVDEVRAGDVCLCFRRQDVDGTAGAKIASTTDSRYTHAAICIGDGRVAEAVSPDGVHAVPINDWIDDFDHVAVFGHLPNEYWDPNRITALREYVGELERGRSSFNTAGMLRFEERKADHEHKIHDKLHAFFRGQLNSGNTSTTCFFCSQFVVTCFIKVGIIDSSAAVVYEPRATAPGTLGRDSVFGYFRGYLLGSQDVPTTDEFYSETTLDEIHSDA